MGRRLRVLAAIAGGTLALAVTTPASAAPPPALSFSSAPSPAYGSVAVGESLDRTFTLRNTGGAASAALVTTLSGSAAFAIPAGGDRCTAVSLGPRKTCTITVRYTPAAAGANDAATLTVRAKKPAAPATLDLTGSSPADPTGQCWSGFFDGRVTEDLLFVGPINTVDNADFYESLDGTCTGAVLASLTLVEAETAQEASAICQTLIAGDYDRMDVYRIDEGGYAAAPADYWFCSPYFLG